MNLRAIFLSAMAGTMLISGSTACWAASVGFVSLVRGKPVLQDVAGQPRPMKLMQGLAPGAIVTLNGSDAVGICHEPAATSYRIEGVGTVRIEEDRIVAQSGNVQVLTVGRCGATASSSETGGVLLRTIKTPK